MRVATQPQSTSPRLLQRHMDHRALRSSLEPEATQDTIREIQPSRIQHLARHWSAIAIVTTLMIAQVPGWPVLILIQGALLVFLLILSHETSHQTAFKSVRLNQAVSWICALILFLPPTRWLAWNMPNMQNTTRFRLCRFTSCCRCMRLCTRIC